MTHWWNGSMSESYHTYERVMSHACTLWVSHVTRIYIFAVSHIKCVSESCHMYTWVVRMYVINASLFVCIFVWEFSCVFLLVLIEPVLSTPRETHTHAHAHTHAYTHAHAHAHAHSQTQTDTGIDKDTTTTTNEIMDMNIDTDTDTDTETDINVHTHTHIHIHIHIHRRPAWARPLQPLQMGS